MKPPVFFKRVIVPVSVMAIGMFALVAVVSFTFPKPKSPKLQPVATVVDIYEQLNLNQLGLSKSVFDMALKGWQKLKADKEVDKSIISICDLTQSSNNRRLYIIDLAEKKLLFNTLVAHGKNSGEEFARFFSNKPSSLQSSLGFFTTKGTYTGQHGLSLKLEGKEPGFNDNAESRAIVMHAADYVCEDFIYQNGRLGRSFGCPSVPTNLVEPIVKTIKDGTCLFIYYPDKNYLSRSQLLK